MASDPANPTLRYDETYHGGLETSPGDGLEPVVPFVPQVDTKEQVSEMESRTSESHTSGPWFGRRCLIITIVVLVIAIAAVGGGVGGALAHKNKQGTGAGMFANPTALNTSPTSLSKVASVSLASQTSPGHSVAHSSLSETSISNPNPTSTGLPPQSTFSPGDPSTNDQLTTTGVAAWFYWGQNSEQLGTLLTQLNARITEIRIVDPSVPTFTVSMIQNTGVYNSSWWWYFGVTADDLSGLLNGRRLISIDPYFDAASNLKFAVVMVPNEGVQNRAWWWYFGIDNKTVESNLQENKARLIALRAYNDGGALHFAVIMIANTGTDYRNSEWYYGVTIQQIADRVSTGLRLISFSPDPFGNWDTILVNDVAEGWWWYYGLRGSQVLNMMGQNNARLVDLSIYEINGAQLFAIVQTDNSG